MSADNAAESGSLPAGFISVLDAEFLCQALRVSSAIAIAIPDGHCNIVCQHSIIEGRLEQCQMPASYDCAHWHLKGDCTQFITEDSAFKSPRYTIHWRLGCRVSYTWVGASTWYSTCHLSSGAVCCSWLRLLLMSTVSGRCPITSDQPAHILGRDVGWGRPG